ncbi:MAG: type I restriction enzyme EcoKI subunit R [Tenericutes bacterium ADurb.Bin140]|nr:MAG: type I restriction enzyme EcoKI subunit R [Tenericutes bacterium ADurb.Bin140]
MQLRDYQIESINATRNEFRTGKKSPCVVLPCGGGKTVCFAFMADQHIKIKPDNSVWFLVHRRELIDQTERTFRDFGIPTERVLIGMVQTVSRDPGKYQRPTLIIFDECHHATAKTWTRIINAFPDVPVVGLTATPARTDGTGLGAVFDSLVLGPSAEELMEKGYLCKYDYYAPKTTDIFALKNRGADYDMQDLSEQFMKSRIYGDVKKYLDPRRKTIIYCPSIELSKQLAAQLPGVVHFDGNTPDKQRAEIVRRFRDGEISALSSVDLIGEGFDVPDCDAVLLLRPTKSTILYIQQSMRCLRPAPGKRAVIYDMVGNCFRHGLPTETREWSLTGRMPCKNESAEPDILVRQCKNCLRVYSGTGRICPYCGEEQPKTRREIEQDEKVELERIEKIERRDKRREQGRAETLEELIAIGRSRGYKNPVFWARMVYNSRTKK